MTPHEPENAPPIEQNRPENAPPAPSEAEAPPSMEDVLARVELLAPEVCNEWRAAMLEGQAARLALEHALTAPPAVAVQYAAVLEKQIVRVSRRLTAATKALADCYDSGVRPMVVVGK